jgi:hypothetical protein
VAKQTDPLQADIDRVYGEYHAARDAYEAASGDQLVKARFDRAQTGLRDTRRQWREIGEASGQRGLFVKADDNSEPPPDLIGRHITGKGEG